MRFFCPVLLLATATFSLADTLYLKDGKTVAGTYLGGTSRQVKMEIADRIESYDVSDVARIEFQSAPAPEPPKRVQLMRPEATPPAPAASTTSMTIPAGTVLKIRMIDAVDSEVSQLGQTFQASLDDPITVNGETVIPRGADVVAKLVEDKQSGKISGRTELTLDLKSIRVNGRMVDLVTEEVTTSSESRTVDAFTFPVGPPDACSPESTTRLTSVGSPDCIAKLTTSFAPTATVMLVRTCVLKPMVSAVIS